MNDYLLECINTKLECINTKLERIVKALDVIAEGAKAADENKNVHIGDISLSQEADYTSD